MILLDTDVMVDIIRGYPPAMRWFSALKETPVLPGFVVMELIAGCQDKRDLALTRKAVGAMNILWPESEHCNKAIADLAQHHLASKLDPNDALIGELAVGLGTTLRTFNVRHFSLIPGLKILKPYAKKKPEGKR